MLVSRDEKLSFVCNRLRAPLVCFHINIEIFKTNWFHFIKIDRMPGINIFNIEVNSI